MDNTPQDEAELKALSQALHQIYDPVLGEPVPARIAARLRARPRRWRMAAIAAGLVLLGLGAGVVAGWQLHVWRTSVPPQAGGVPAFVKRAAVAHAVYSPEVRHPVEVAADQEKHLVAWLSKRLGAPLRAPKLEDVGYSLIGGRLLPGESGPAGAPSPVAQFMYQCKQGTRVTMYVRTDSPGNRETAFRYASEGSVKVFYWIDHKLGYAISSADISKDDLLKVANAVYQQLNP
jgi:anti-sigma factor RsiW